ncbi:MAG: hypothetical protein B7Y36_03680 [Novosphingobium sp. 28-62-57]|uniref:alginate export family protein n=1 Tax=Novosphingobium sp. 28-62-57 TaxID=1970409 RepID=UPI000BD6ECAA|nr:alginate export family protein [Novosphingobium sp. 28-62-57]OYZ12609.1 MAG: hypothetical protein B7Y36_03680 [Novosphingobium sp. 28-62-57]
MSVPALAVLAAAWPLPAAHAQELTVKPIIDARLHFEHIDQDGIAMPADALTIRTRAGAELGHGPFSLLVEGEATAVVIDRYNDGFNGLARPVVADPGNAELNRAQLRYTDHGLAFTVGRQRLELADQRFVGPAAWRQNEQTFDAARLQWTGLKRLTVDATYAWSVRTVNGNKGTPARPQSINGDNIFVIVSYAAPVGTLSGFAYLVDQDSAALSGFRLSSQTYGARLSGTQPLGGGWKLGYTASLARQSAYARNPNRYAATYGLAEANLSHKAVTGTAGFEVLGAGSGTPLTSVQTPLASFFRFQGWASKFTITPPDGVRDAYATLAANWKHDGWISNYGLGATYHRLTSDRLARRYGDELDLIASARIKGYTVAARLAHYVSRSFSANTDKVLVTVDWQL